MFCNFIGHVIFGPLYNAAGGHIGIGLLFTARINPAIKLASTYPTQQIVDAKPLEFFFLVVHSFIGNAMYVCFPPTQLAKIKLQVSIMVVVAECYQVASPFLSGKAIIWYHRMRKYRCAEGQHLTNQPTTRNKYSSGLASTICCVGHSETL